MCGERWDLGGDVLAEHSCRAQTVSGRNCGKRIGLNTDEVTIPGMIMGIEQRTGGGDHATFA